MAVNLVLYILDDAIMVMTMERSSLGRSADGDNGYQGDGGSKKQVFHVSLVSIGG